MRKRDRRRLAREAELAEQRVAAQERIEDQETRRRAVLHELLDRALNDGHPAALASLSIGQGIKLGQLWAPGCRYYADFSGMGGGPVRILAPELSPHSGGAGWERHQSERQPAPTWVKTEGYE